MKTIKHTIFIILLCLNCNTVIMSQSLDSIPTAKRDSILIAIAKEVVLKYGLDYYREYKQPVIERSVVPEKGAINKTGLNAGRVLYKVTFLYDKTQETLEWNYAAKVTIWADTRHPTGVDFGNGMGFVLGGSDWRKNADGLQMKYNESTRPIYNWVDPDPNKKPLNLEDLKRKGYEEQSDGQWVKTTQDTPPVEAQRVIKRALENMKSEVK